MANINDLGQGGQVRQPRGLVKINGTPLPGWSEWSVENNTAYQADTFRVAFALAKLPPEYDAAWWASQTKIAVEIFAGFPSDPSSFTASDLESLIYGNTDEVDYNPTSRIVTITGRDLTALFIDSKTTEEWRNHSSSDVAIELAQRHGLTTTYIAATSNRIGSYYEIDHVLSTNQHSEWDLLTYLASKEGFVVFVKGQDLHFEPKPDTSQIKPYLLAWEPPQPGRASPSFDGIEIRFTRDLTVAKGVVVWVQAINSKTKQTIVQAYPPSRAKGTRPGQSSPTAQVYTFRLRNREMSAQQALEFAQAKHREITQHELRLVAHLPGDNLMAADGVIEVSGTGSTFDQTYYPESVEREMSAPQGYVMTVRAKNIAHDNEVPL